MGAHLRRFEDDPEKWGEALEKLQNAAHLAPGEEQLFSRLRISYDARGPAEKGMFLDVAFFFMGRSADAAKRAWLGCADACVCTLMLCMQSHLLLHFSVYSAAPKNPNACRCEASALRHLYLLAGQKMGMLIAGSMRQLRIQTWTHWSAAACWAWMQKATSQCMTSCATWLMQ